MGRAWGRTGPLVSGIPAYRLIRALMDGRDKSLVKLVTRWVRRNWPPDVASPDLRSGLAPAGASQHFKLGEGHDFFGIFEGPGLLS